MNRLNAQSLRFASKARALSLVVVAAAVAPAAMAQDAATMGAQVVEKVNAGLTQGELIAGAVVLGLFAIWAIKLLWRAK